jgi:hypothetical protein
MAQYDPGFVERVLKADAAPNEATFDNVIDMMNWLELPGNDLVGSEG